MRIWITAIAIMLATCLAVGSADAKAPKAKSKDKAVSGTISSIANDGGSFVLQAKGKKGAGGASRTITINASTTIEINGTAGKTAKDLSTGMMVKVKLSGDAASDISAGKSSTKKKKKV